MFSIVRTKEMKELEELKKRVLVLEEKSKGIMVLNGRTWTFAGTTMPDYDRVDIREVLEAIIYFLNIELKLTKAVEAKLVVEKKGKAK